MPVTSFFRCGRVAWVQLWRRENAKQTTTTHSHTELSVSLTCLVNTIHITYMLILRKWPDTFTTDYHWLPQTTIFIQFIAVYWRSSLDLLLFCQFKKESKGSIPALSIWVKCFFSPSLQRPFCKTTVTLKPNRRRAPAQSRRKNSGAEPLMAPRLRALSVSAFEVGPVGESNRATLSSLNN